MGCQVPKPKGGRSPGEVGSQPRRECCVQARGGAGAQTLLLSAGSHLPGRMALTPLWCRGRTTSPGPDAHASAPHRGARCWRPRDRGAGWSSAALPTPALWRRTWSTGRRHSTPHFLVRQARGVWALGVGGLGWAGAGGRDLASIALCREPLRCPEARLWDGGATSRSSRAPPSFVGRARACDGAGASQESHHQGPQTCAFPSLPPWEPVRCCPALELSCWGGRAGDSDSSHCLSLCPRLHRHPRKK